MNKNSNRKPLSDESIQELYKASIKLDAEREELDELIQNKSGGFSNLNFDDLTWSPYYMLPWELFLVIVMDCFGVLDEIKKVILNSEDPNKAMLEYIASDPESPLDEDELSDEEALILFGLAQALSFNIIGYKQFGIPINTMISKSKVDESYLFWAISIDRSAVSCPLIASRIAKAEIEHDESFMAKLAKSITKTVARRPKPEYDELRFVVACLIESDTFSSKTIEEIHDLLVYELGLYPHSGKDSFASLSKLMQKQRNITRN